MGHQLLLPPSASSQCAYPDRLPRWRDAKQPDQSPLCPAVVLIAKGETNIFESSRETFAAFQMRCAAFFFFLFFLPFKPITRNFYTFRHAHRAWRRCSHTHWVTIFQCVL